MPIASDGKGSASRGKEERANLEADIRVIMVAHAYVRTTFTTMAYLAFTWSTVVLLGGFVSSLQKKDFQCLTVITVVEAISIFNDLEADGRLKIDIWKIRKPQITGAGVRQGRPSGRFRILTVGVVRPLIIVQNMFSAYGPVISIGLSLWRLIVRDYATTHREEASLANLTPALDFFFLVLFQGYLYQMLISIFLVKEDTFISQICEKCKFPQEWGNCISNCKALSRS